MKLIMENWRSFVKENDVIVESEGQEPQYHRSHDKSGGIGTRLKNVATGRRSIKNAFFEGDCPDFLIYQDKRWEVSKSKSQSGKNKPTKKVLEDLKKVYWGSRVGKGPAGSRVAAANIIWHLWREIPGCMKEMKMPTEHDIETIMQYPEFKK